MIKLNRCVYGLENGGRRQLLVITINPLSEELEHNVSPAFKSLPSERVLCIMLSIAIISEALK